MLSLQLVFCKRFQTCLNRFFNVFDSVFYCFSLRKTTRQTWTTGNKTPKIFVFLKNNFESHNTVYNVYCLIFLMGEKVKNSSVPKVL